MITDISSYRITDEVQNNTQSFFVPHNSSTSFSYRIHRNRFSILVAQTRYRHVSTHLQLFARVSTRRHVSTCVSIRLGTFQYAYALIHPCCTLSPSFFYHHQYSSSLSDTIASFD